MREGWCNDDYWSLCEEQDEAKHLTDLYGLAEYLPRYFIIGLKGWDNFILSDPEGNHFSAPTVPLEPASLVPFHFPSQALRLASDARFTGKIKWYVKPIRFGGDPSAKENLTWLSVEEHAQAVKWWATFYHDTLTNNRETLGHDTTVLGPPHLSTNVTSMGDSRPRSADGVFTDEDGISRRVVVVQAKDGDPPPYAIFWVGRWPIGGGYYQTFEAAMRAAKEMEPTIEWKDIK
jgi:hypothetical protein